MHETDRASDPRKCSPPEVMRERTWDEMGLEQKVEALNRVLIDCSFHVGMQERDMKVLKVHGHMDGKIVAQFTEIAGYLDLPHWARCLRNAR